MLTDRPAGGDIKTASAPQCVGLVDTWESKGLSQDLGRTIHRGPQLLSVSGLHRRGSEASPRSSGCRFHVLAERHLLAPAFSTGNLTSEAHLPRRHSAPIPPYLPTCGLHFGPSLKPSGWFWVGAGRLAPHVAARCGPFSVAAPGPPSWLPEDGMEAPTQGGAGEPRQGRTGSKPPQWKVHPHHILQLFTSLTGSGILT